MSIIFLAGLAIGASLGVIATVIVGFATIFYWHFNT